jgi:D-alanyl-D-alanine carboxypeptidase (penicillin-binding protein 5/6)
MRRLLVVLAACAAFAAAASPSFAGPPPEVGGVAYLVADPATGEILTAANEDARTPIASITKLMTAIVALEHAKPSDVVTVSQRSSTVGESTIHLQPGERVTVRDLLAAALIQSANDAAFALAGYVGHGDVRAFVRLMNAKARELGLEHTHFVRPDGLDTPGHVSSAADVLVLAREAMKRPLLRRLVRQRTESISGGRTLHTWNDLLGRYRGLYGVKTGHTEKAGWCEVAVARRDGVTLYAVVLGGSSRERRNADLAALLDWGFDQYGRRRVVDASRTYATAEVPFHEDEPLPLVAARGASVVLPLARPLVETVVAPAVVGLPVRKGQRLGEILVTDNGHVVARRPLVAGRDIEAPGLVERSGWYAAHALSEAGDMVSNLLGSIL